MSRKLTSLFKKHASAKKIGGFATKNRIDLLPWVVKFNRDDLWHKCKLSDNYKPVLKYATQPTLCRLVDIGAPVIDKLDSLFQWEYVEACSVCNKIQPCYPSESICSSCARKRNWSKRGEFQWSQELDKALGTRWLISQNTKIPGATVGYRPDKVYRFGSQTVIVEYDENRHRHYKGEEKRMLEIMEDLSSCTFVRYNAGCDKIPLCVKLINWLLVNPTPMRVYYIGYEEKKVRIPSVWIK